MCTTVDAGQTAAPSLPLAHHGPHAPPPVDVAALVARWIQQRYQESNQPIAIKASLLRQELLDSGIRVGRDKLYRVLEHLVSPPDPDNPKTKAPFERERIDQVWHYSPYGYQGSLQKIRPPRKAGTHQEPTGNSAGTHRELTGNSAGTHQELTGNSPGTQPQQEALVCPKHQIKLRRSKHRSGAFYCPATDPTGRNGYCVYTFAAAEMPAGVNLNVNPGKVDVPNEDSGDGDAGAGAGLQAVPPDFDQAFLMRHGHAVDDTDTPCNFSRCPNNPGGNRHTA